MAAWEATSSTGKLPPNEVHVWLVAQEIFQAAIPYLHTLLDKDQVEKAARFYFEKDRHRFVIAHGLLRLLLERYTGVLAAQLRYSYNPHGKPEVVCANKDKPNFNLSHTHNLIAYAFSLRRQVGIDIEYMRTTIEYDQLARHYFSPFEYDQLQQLPLAMRQQAFFHCWTRKEAYIKARGLGLSLDLASFDVTVQPNQGIRLLASRENAQETTRWLFVPLPLEENYAGTLVAEGQDWQMLCRKLLPQDI